MACWKLYTNEAPLGRYVGKAPTREQMWAYIRKKRAEGMALSAIIFCWGRVL